jgi:hypothetical protein
LSNQRSVTFEFVDSLELDSLMIIPSSFVLRCNDEEVASNDYQLNFSESKLYIKNDCGGPYSATFRVYPFDLSEPYQLRDTSLIYSKEKGMRENFLITNQGYTVNDVFGGTSLSKSGSISRGVTFGNNQDLGINSTLNLELSGKIAPNLNLLASISDDNLPIQPDGNTNKLREFDQVFIQVYNDRLKMIAGDFWLYKPKGYFMSYKKRAQGLTVNYQWNQDTSHVWKTQVSGALSRGKFNRQIIQGVEGNQGPYRLRGAENEPFIIILSGTERVYIDGNLLERGQEFDYIIDYNIAEVTFTSRNQITKDSRIVIEFQYSDQNYARSLFQTSTTYHSKKMDFWINAYSEQDARNQTLQQELSNGQKQQLAAIGDSLELARTTSIDSIGYFDNQNLYKLIDSLGYDTVLVYSVHPDSAYYRVTFEYVGPGNGDYILEGYNALGKVYQWVVPVAGIPQGDYAPSRLMITPKKRQMVNSGIRYQFTDFLKIESEISYTNNDLNTFSRIDSRDNSSIGAWNKLTGIIPLRKGENPSQLELKLENEIREAYYTPIEQYRTVEFDRDWNTRGKGFDGNQIATNLGAKLIRKKNGSINLEGQQYLIGNDYEGWRAASDGKWSQKGFRAVWDGSLLSSKTDQQNQFVRHRADISQQLGWIRIGYKDDHELNTFRTDVLEGNSYQFFDYQFYIANGDSIKNNYKVFYRERYDQRSDGTALRAAAKARSIGSEFGFTNWKNHRLNVITAYRELEITDSILIQETPENSLLGRVEYQMDVLKGAISMNNFYEVGSGLELKREFLYIQVNDGQGVYTWVDYNNDGVKDLNEFEIAQFIDQASYIRVFTPSNEYVKTYSNELNQSIHIRPERVWGRSKGFKKFIARFSDQARVRISRKTNYFTGVRAFNPFITEVADSNLISTNSNIRNTLFFNRTSSVFGMEYNVQNVQGKTLLASGFDSRSNRFNEIGLRLNMKKKFTLKLSAKQGEKAAEADYTSGRDYRLNYVFLEPSFIFQPNTIFRTAIEARYSNKLNAEELGGEESTVYEVGLDAKLSRREKGILQVNAKVLNITYDGQQNSALGFEMLEALKPGVNYTWGFGYQRVIARNLQMSIQYQGRKSVDNRAIHSGGMEVRAFF